MYLVTCIFCLFCLYFFIDISCRFMQIYGKVQHNRNTFSTVSFTKHVKKMSQLCCTCHTHHQHHQDITEHQKWQPFLGTIQAHTVTVTVCFTQSQSQSQSHTMGGSCSWHGLRQYPWTGRAPPRRLSPRQRGHRGQRRRRDLSALAIMVMSIEGHFFVWCVSSRYLPDLYFSDFFTHCTVPCFFRNLNKTVGFAPVM